MDLDLRFRHTSWVPVPVPNYATTPQKKVKQGLRYLTIRKIRGNRGNKNLIIFFSICFFNLKLMFDAPDEAFEANGENKNSN